MKVVTGTTVIGAGYFVYGLLLPSWFVAVGRQLNKESRRKRT